MTSFCHLHLHTVYSEFDGFNEIENVIKKGIQEGMNHFALTDHNNIFSWFDFCGNWGRKNVIHPIYGIELNVEKHHLVALAISNVGLKNISKLNNIGYLKGTSKNRVQESDVFKHKDGIYFLSGCARGAIPQLIIEGRFQEAEKKTAQYQEIFADRFGLEVQNYKNALSKKTALQLMSLAKKYKIPLIPTNDVHYLNQSDYPNQSGYVEMKTMGKIKQNNRENYFKTKLEMEEIFSKRLLSQTLRITTNLEVHFENYLEEMRGENEVPVSMVYYYGEIEAIKKVLYAQKKYKLAEFIAKEMTKKDLSLKEMKTKWGELKNEIQLAQSMVGKIIKIEPDPYHYIRVGNDFPIYKKNKQTKASAQMDIFTAERNGFEVYDNRKLIYA